MKKLMFAAVAAMACAGAFGATLEVGSGKTYATPAAALAAAGDGDVILLADETFVLDATLDIAKSVTFKSASGDRAKCVISGGDAVPLVYIANNVNKRIVFDSITLTHGAGAADRAAGITMKENGQRDMQLFVTNCVISYCKNGVSDYGGAALLRTQGANANTSFIGCEICYNEQNVKAGGNYGGPGLNFWYQYSPGTLIENCDFHHNTSTQTSSFGGGLRMMQTKLAKVRDCRFYENKAVNGGGVYLAGDNTADSVVMSDCEIYDNTATSSGGGVMYGGGATVSNCKIHDNTASSGGGAAMGSSTYGHLIDCEIADNTAANGGGVSYQTVQGKTAQTVRCTFSGNKATSGGGAVYATAQWTNVRNEFRNCVFTGNSAANGGAVSYNCNSVVSGTAHAGTHAFVNCTFAKNTATSNGGCFDIRRGSIELEGRFAVLNCAFVGNTKNSSANEIYADKEDFLAQFSTCATDVAGQLPEGNVVADTAAFADFAGGDYTPVYEGDLYDAATLCDWMADATDFLGNRRVSTFGVPKKPDIGAIEWQANTKFGECEAAGHPHKEVDPGYPATCTEPGLTDGVTCPDCETVLSEKEVIAALGHDLDEGTFEYAPTVVSAGRRACTCQRCEQKVKTPIAALGLDYAINGTPEILAKEAALVDEDGVVYVATDGNDDTGTGKLAAPFATIAGALAKTTGNVEVRVLHGVYTLTAAIELPGSRTMKICAASGDRNAVVLDANHSCPAVIGKTKDASVDLCDLTVINAQGTTDSSGGNVCGGAFDFYGILRAAVSNCALVGCVSPKSAAIGFESCLYCSLVDSQLVACSNLLASTSWNYAGGVYYKDSSGNVLEDTTFVGCYCANNGGAASGQSGNARRCRFYDNRAKGAGGAFYNFHNYGDIVDCVFEGNVSEGNGGAIAVTSSSSPVVSGCTFADNAAKNGGGVYMTVASAVRNSYFADNAATEKGGAVYQQWKDSSTFAHSVESCTFVGNTAPAASGAGLYLNGAGAAAGSFGIADSVFFGNTAAGVANALDGVGALVSAVTTSATDFDAGLPEGNVLVDASDFALAAGGVYAPAFGGRLYDAAETLGWMTADATDALGNRRVSSYGLVKKPDIGAIEWQASSRTDECAHGTTTVLHGYGATCEKAGLTDGLYCEICETVIRRQQAIAALGHRLVGEHAYDATVVSAGRDDSRCTREGCGHLEKTPIAALGLDYAINGTPEILAKEAALLDEDGVVYVATDGNDDTGTGRLDAPFATIAGALAKTTGAVEVRVLHGVYTLTAAIDLPGNRTMKICAASGDRNAVVLDANHACPAVVGKTGGASVDLCDLTVINAQGTADSSGGNVCGGAFDFYGISRAAVSNCVLVGCVSPKSAAIGFESCAYCALVDSQLVACSNLLASTSWNYAGGVYYKDCTSGNVLEGTTFVGCYCANNGGAASGQTGNARRCRFYDNRAKGAGGAFYSFANYGDIADCLFDGNASEGAGGAVLLETASGSMISNCVFRGNAAATSGGGVFWKYSNQAGDLHEIVDCTFEGNRAAASSGDWERKGGGAIHAIRPPNGLIRNCKLIGNTAAQGAGIYLEWDSFGNDARRIDLRNLLIARNEATVNGAGVYVYNSVSNWVMDACTVVDNAAGASGAANFYVESVYNNGSNGSLALRNTVLGGGAPNLAAKAGVWADWAKGFDFLATDSATLPVPESANNLLGIAWFGFEDAEACDYRPRKGSVLVDAGLTEDWMLGRRSRDLAGERRLRGDAVDFGAYEYQKKPGLLLIVR